VANILASAVKIRDCFLWAVHLATCPCLHS